MVCFQTKNPNSGKIWRALHRMENAGIFYDHFTAVWYLYLWPFGKVVVILYTFTCFGKLCQEKFWQPWSAFSRFFSKAHGH
jgi:hypothetical protein